MRLINNFQSINNQKNYKFNSPAFMGGKPKVAAQLTEELFAKFPEKIKQQILKENPDLFSREKTIVSKSTKKSNLSNKSKGKILDMALGDITRIDSKLDSVTQVLDELAEVFKSKESVANKIKRAKKQIISAKGDVQRADTKIREASGVFKAGEENATQIKKEKFNIDKELQGATAYKSSKYLSFNQILDSKGCKKDHVEVILNNINSIRVDYRHVLIEKMIDVAERNKDVDLMKKIYNNLYDKKIKLDDRKIPNSFKKFVEAGIKIKANEEFIFETFMTYTKKEVSRYSVENCAELNKKMVKYALKTQTDKLFKNFIEFNNKYYDKLNLPTQERKQLLKRYQKIENSSDWFLNWHFSNLSKDV